MSVNVAIVTGASSGIGTAFAQRIDHRGDVDEIWLIARRKNRLEDLAASLIVPAYAISLDLTSQTDIDTFDALLKRKKPTVRYLVNAAGLGCIGSIDTLSNQSQSMMVDLNCRASIELTTLVRPYLSRGSRILEIVSCAAFTPLPYFGVYAATKAFMLSYTRSLRWELHGTGIRITAVCPAWVKTEFIEKAQSTDSSAIRHFPFAQRPDVIARRALSANTCHFAVACCSLTSFLLRIVGKFLPHCITMAGWEGIRRL
jgi:short-subunit dehydrogenase